MRKFYSTKKYINSRCRKPGSNKKTQPKVDINALTEKLIEEIAEEKEAERKDTAKKNSDSSKAAKKKRGAKTSAVEKLYIVSNAASKLKSTKGKKKVIYYGETLKGCKTIKDAAGFVAKTHEQFVGKAERAIARRKIPDKYRAGITDLLTKPEATSNSIMTNPRVASDGFKHLHKGLMDIVHADPTCQMAFVTLLAGDWETSSACPDIDLYGAQKRAKSTLRAMGTNFVAVTELVLFNSIGHADGGQLVNHHQHAIIFGDLKKASYIANRHRKHYPPNCTGADPIKITPITDLSEENLARVVAYMLKAPSKAINYCPPIDGKPGFLNKSEKGDRKIRYLRMAQLRSMLTFEDCFYAGGQGLAIRKTVIDVLRSLAASDAPPNQQAMHPDAIPAFWVEVAKELGREDWALPIIKRRP